MTDREKVINALGRCESYGYCEDKRCPYYEDTGCLESMRKDALELLKEQEQRINFLEERLRLLEYGDQGTLQSGLMPAT